MDRIRLVRLAVGERPDVPSKLEWNRPEATRIGVSPQQIDEAFLDFFTEKEVQWS